MSLDKPKKGHSIPLRPKTQAQADVPSNVAADILGSMPPFLRNPPEFLDSSGRALHRGLVTRWIIKQVRERRSTLEANAEPRAPESSNGSYAIIAQKDESVGGMQRVNGEIRLAPGKRQSAAPSDGAKHADLTLRVVGDRGTVEILHAVGGATSVAASTVRAEVGRRFELFFHIASAEAARVQVELVHVGALNVEPLVLGDDFDAVPPPTAAPTDDWLDRVTSEFRCVYEHIARHGVIDEAEVVAALGGARAVRRFSSTIDAERDKLPFAVRVEPTAVGKRWVREGGPR